MKNCFLVCNTAELAVEIEKAKAIISSRNVNDIWGAVLLELDNSVLIIKSTDKNMFFESRISVISNDTFKVLINVFNFSDALKALNLFRNLRIVFDIDENKLVIEGEKEFLEQASTDEEEISFVGRLYEPVFSSEDLASYVHEMEDIGNLNSIFVENELLKDIINKVAFSASNDENRNILNGILFVADNIDRKLTLVATNGHRVSIYNTEIVLDSELYFIVPVKLFIVLRQFIATEASILIKYSENKFYVESNYFKLSCSLMTGHFPDYKSILPVKTPNQCSITLNILKDRLVRASLYSDKRSRRIILDFSKEELKITARDSNGTRTGEFLVGAPSYTYTGDYERVAINSGYLLDIINALSSTAVIISFKTGGILKFSEYTNSNFVHLIMPMVLG